MGKAKRPFEDVKTEDLRKEYKANCATFMQLQDLISLQRKELTRRDKVEALLAKVAEAEAEHDAESASNAKGNVL